MGEDQPGQGVDWTGLDCGVSACWQTDSGKLGQDKRNLL